MYTNSLLFFITSVSIFVVFPEFVKIFAQRWGFNVIFYLRGRGFTLSLCPGGNSPIKKFPAVWPGGMVGLGTDQSIRHKQKYYHVYSKFARSVPRLLNKLYNSNLSSCGNILEDLLGNSTQNVYGSLIELFMDVSNKELISSFTRQLFRFSFSPPQQVNFQTIKLLSLQNFHKFNSVWQN